MSELQPLALPSLENRRYTTRVEDACVVSDVDSIPWTKETDFVVVGYGGAGVCAALEAAECGLQVIALDRFEGGGSTAINGGVVYAGGGTSIQKEAGYPDTPEDMYRYLQREVGDVVSPELLKDFCDNSTAMLEWLEQRGVRFNSTAYAQKISYPNTKYFLYYSDNCLLTKNSKDIPPAPRGHKCESHLINASSGQGRAMYKPLADAAASLGVEKIGQADVTQLLIDSTGRVIGVKAVAVPKSSPEYNALRNARFATQKWLRILPFGIPGSSITHLIARYFARKAAKIESRAAENLYIRARRGVCLSGGGFAFNLDMLKAFAPRFTTVMPLGTPGDNGSAILLGHSAGAVLSRMGDVSAWRFLNPPRALSMGMMVNSRGERFVDESSYGATIGGEMMNTTNNGVGWLILDQPLWRQLMEELKHPDLGDFQKYPVQLSRWFSMKKASTIEGLAKKLNMPVNTLSKTASDYHRAAVGQIEDVLQKSPKDMSPMTEGPFYAFDQGGANPYSPLPAITVGGLLLDEKSGLVLREDGSTIPGLYAAGRTAVGLCSNVYLSGLSVSDCIYSGRRAGRHAAGMASTTGYAAKQQNQRSTSQ